jgi:CheY-like chemotaxis protein
MRILVVDDDEANRNLFARMLMREGHIVETAGCGLEGLRRFRKGGPFDRVLSDWNMPIMNGFAMVTEILKLDPTTRIVMMSGDHSNQPPPGVPLLGKPFSREDLLNALR